MKPRYVLAPEAAQDLVEIWNYLVLNISHETAKHVETVVREKMAFLANNPRAGHWRRDLTEHEVKFFPVYSYLIVYRPNRRPLEIVSILHGHRDIEQILKGRPS